MGKADEKKFFDEGFAGHTRRPLYRYYALTRTSENFFRGRVFADCGGKRVLEYGCGIGSHALPLAEKGAEVVGIDISSVAIVKAAEEAHRRNLGNARFIEMDAEAMSFPDDSFDLIVGTAILHHLDLPRALSELARVMRPRGRALFLEPLGHNPALNIFRKLTPQWRTEDEHPLVRGELALLRRNFGKVELTYFHLSSFLSLLLLKTRFFFPVYRALERLDRWIFKVFPPIASWAWYVSIELGEPGEPRPGDSRGTVYSEAGAHPDDEPPDILA